MKLKSEVYVLPEEPFPLTNLCMMLCLLTYKKVNKGLVLGNYETLPPFSREELIQTEQADAAWYI